MSDNNNNNNNNNSRISRVNGVIVLDEHKALLDLPSTLDISQRSYRRSNTGGDGGYHHQRRPSLVRRASSLIRFNEYLSTEEHNSVDTEPIFCGPYAHIRKDLDYTYHKYYRKERQWLQDSIIEDLLDITVEDETVCITPSEPWLIFTAGPRGAGKRHVIRELVTEERLPILGYVHVDSDEIRRRLPEFDSYANKVPDMVDQLTFKESGYIAEILTLAAIQEGRNVICDGAMKTTTWHLRLIQKLKLSDDIKHINYKFAIFHITAPMDQILARIARKEVETGRAISHIATVEEMEGVKDSIEILKPHVNFTCEIHNGKEEMELVGDMNWETFEVNFLQMCAWKPGMGKGKQRMSRRISMQEQQTSRRSMLQRANRSHRRFSVLISSEENNRMDEMLFYGKYSHIRKTLDYNYHANYTFERQMLQDAIISDMLDAAFILDEDGNIGTVPTEPFIVFTAGAMGAGKGHTMNVLVEKGRFPLKAFVIVDPDEVRRLLPEYHMYIHENAELAGELTRKEAGFIAEILTLAALQAGKNVLQDGSLRDSDWYQIYFQRLKEEFPNVRQAILHVTAPRDAVFRRAAERAITTGRIVPREVLEMALEQVPKSVKILAPLVDYFAEFNNDQNATDIELVKPEGCDWETFRSVWVQKVAYVPNRKKILDKAKKELGEQKQQQQSSSSQTQTQTNGSKSSLQ